jgi:hypothetical protein
MVTAAALLRIYVIECEGAGAAKMRPLVDSQRTPDTAAPAMID